MSPTHYPIRTRARVAAGVSEGGQYATMPKRRGNTVTLGSDTDDPAAASLQQLKDTIRDLPAKPEPSDITHVGALMLEHLREHDPAWREAHDTAVDIAARRLSDAKSGVRSGDDVENKYTMGKIRENLDSHAEMTRRIETGQVYHAGAAVSSIQDAEFAIQSYLDGIARTSASYNRFVRVVRDRQLALLGELRDMGGDIDILSTSQPRAAAVVRDSARFFPATWLNHTNRDVSDSQPTCLPVLARTTSSQVKAYYETLIRGRSREEVAQIADESSVAYWLGSATPHRVKKLPNGDYAECDISDRHFPGAELVDIGGVSYYQRIRVAKKHRPTARLSVFSAKVMGFATDGARKADSTSVHELTHRMESYNAQIGDMEVRYRASRSRSEHTYQQRVDAGFPDPYAGRIYMDTAGHNASAEVLPVGIESAFFGRTGLFQRLDGTRDTDYQQFVLGALAAL